MHLGANLKKKKLRNSSLSLASMANMRENKVASEISLISVLLFLLQLFFSLNQVNSYIPDDNLAINCGSSGNTTSDDNRKWVGDVDVTKLFSTIEPQIAGQKSVIAEALNSLPSSVDKFPFGSARLSYSNFTYSFPVVTNGPVFLRLHFYPTSYGADFEVEPSNALFSVKVGSNLTLLKDFNASLWVNNDQKTVTKEYCIQIEAAAGERLNVTFLPSTTNLSGAAYYAFINGIEVVSMPPFLYYANLTDPNIKYVGRSIPYQVRNDKALEMLYRVNVGDNQVPPSQDTGMFRYWDNDFPRYLEKQYRLSVSSVFRNLHLKYRNNTAVKDYTAPADVYLTARSYGKDTTDENYDEVITWNFEVDSEFTYMVRLHFCEFDPEIKQKGDRVFLISIADSLVEPKADVIEWSGGNLIPVYKDYAVPVPLYMPSQGSSESQRVNLSVKLQRMPAGYSVHRDILMNGIEIFKISDKKNNLAVGPNPKPLNLSPKQQQTHSSKKSKSSTIVIVAAVVAVSALVLASIVGIMVFVRRRRRSTQSSHNNDDMEEKSWKTKNEGSSYLPSHLCRYFTIAEIRAATNNFDDVFIVGVGGFGNVYKGCIDGSTPVAIKRLKPGSQQGANEFMNEIELLSQLCHVHLVSLIGYCNDGAEMILVYDFMQRGTLREYLYGSDNPWLSWKQRLEILLGAARGLHYLHVGAKHIIHRDVKSTNILLDEKWVAKVSDFGLSKVGPSGISTTHVSTAVKGSLGYLDPEYYLREQLTFKSDVYSFGVVLLEVLCARPPLVRAMDKKKASLVGWFQRCHDEGVIIEQVVDPFIRDSITGESLKCYCQLALSCLRDDGDQRPSMSDVVGALEFALQLVVSEEDRMIGGAQEEGKRLTEFMSDKGSDVCFTSSDDYRSQTGKVSSTVSATTKKQPLFSSTTVFSEIGNPTTQ